MSRFRCVANVGVTVAMIGVLAGCADEDVASPARPDLHGSSGGIPVVLTGVGTAVVDGVLDPDEWAGAGSVVIDAALPASEGGGTTPVTLRVMNDLENLYLALEIDRPYLPGSATSVAFEFDNDHSGNGYGEGDDALVVNADPWGPTGATFFDNFRTSLPPCPAGLVCGFSDVDQGGTRDGGAAGISSGTRMFMEIWHPLDGDDDAHDFSLAAGDVVGVGVFLRFIAPGSAWPDGFGDTDLPFGWGDIVIARMSPEVLVRRLLEMTGEYPGLTAVLEAVLRALTADRPAVGALLRAFIYEVDAMVRSDRLTAEDAAALRALGEAALAGVAA